MNRRTLKKICQRAVPILISKHGFAKDAFVLADGDESIDAPTTMERRFVRHGWLHPGPLRGTPLLFQRTSYEYDEWDHSLPSLVLAECELWANLSIEEMERLCA